ncbi:MAG TPA: three-Cys-motif partner protein TcmP [Myxococcaceae bacterium]|nr:three-Cys-motif partner protein TcmP [Myxococcaceae bacterium]
MTDILPTTWPADPHTLAKHKILEGYLHAWMPILATLKKGALFIDGFAGPGEYEGGQEGSPVIALKAALKNAPHFKNIVHFLFVENRPDRFEHLNEVLSRYSAQIRSTPKINVLPPRCGECADVLREFLAGAKAKNKQHGPWLAFLDQFGYSQVPMSLIAEIMGGEKCEVLTYLEFRKLGQFITDETKWPAITAAFGSEEWKGAIPLRGHARERFIAESYVRALRQRGGATYVWHFAMKGENNALIYWLFFCTKSDRGLEEMKKAMLRVDDSGSFVFSDAANPDQLSLMSAGLAEEWLPKHLVHHFRGQTVALADVRRHVLVDTPVVTFKKALADLERGGALQVMGASPTRRRGTFPEDDPRLRLRFLGETSND